MAGAKALVPVFAVESRIYFVRGEKVMLDSDLAELYGVTTTRLNEQVKRNPDRFPLDFMFQLTGQEVTSLMSQFATSKIGRGGRRKLPYVFTEHGAIMLASVLNSPRAVEASIFVVRAFVKLREIETLKVCVVDALTQFKEPEVCVVDALIHHEETEAAYASC